MFATSIQPCLESSHIEDNLLAILTRFDDKTGMVIGPAIRQGLEQGHKQGHDEGRRDLLCRQLEKRFGALPKLVETRLASLSTSQLDEIALRILDATRLEELFPNKQ